MSALSVDNCCCPFRNLLAGLPPANIVQLPATCADYSLTLPLSNLPMLAAPWYSCCKLLLDS